MGEHRDVIVVGGGVIGIATAYYLAKAGLSVRVFEQDTIGSGSSYGNCGLISPSHAPPLTQPGVIAKSLKWMLRPDSPFRVKPTLNPRTLWWFLEFAKRCDKDRMRPALDARLQLLMQSRQLYDQLFADHPMAVDWDEAGALFVWRDAEGLDAFAADTMLFQDAGLEVEILDGQQLHEKEPAVRDDLAGAAFFPIDAHLRPDRLMTEWHQLVVEMGVDVMENCPVTEFATSANQVTGVTAERGKFTADHVVLATGAWAPLLAPQLSESIPILPGKGYSVTMKRPGNCPRIPCLFQERKAVATPWQSGYRLGGTMEFCGYNSDINQVRVNAIRQAATEYMQEPEGEISEAFWSGWRPMTFDGVPIIDRSQRFSNVVLAAGHNMLGLSMAPATGRLVTALVTGKEPDIDPKLYSRERFR